MSIETVIGLANQLPVEALFADARFIARHEQNDLALRIEGEGHSPFASSSRWAVRHYGASRTNLKGPTPPHHIVKPKPFALQLANSRMKDFYDVWVLLKAYAFDEVLLAKAIAATFERRRTAIPSNVPDAFTPEFALDASKRQQWDAFVRELMASPGSLETVVSHLAAFLMPLAEKARSSTRNKD